MKAGGVRVAVVLSLALIVGCSQLPPGLLGGDGPAPAGKGGGAQPLDMLRREADCSMTLLRIDQESRAVVSSVPNHHRRLRADAGLPPLDDEFAAGCDDAVPGAQGQPGLAIGGLGDGRYYGVATPPGSGGSVFAYVSDGEVEMPTPDVIALLAPTAESGFIAGIVAGVFDGVGRNDAVVSAVGLAAAPGSHSQLVRLESDADGVLAIAATFPASANGNNLAAIDLDGDGDLDLVQGHYLAVEVRLNAGDGSFSAPTTLAGASGDVVAGDVDGDGIADIVTTNGQVQLGNGDGTFAAHPATIATGGQIFRFALGDIDGDGDADLVTLTLTDVTDIGQQFVRIHRNDSSGTFTPLATGLVAVPSIPSVHLTHIDGDDNLDIVLGAAGAGLYGPDQNGPGTLQVLLGLGDGRFAGPPAFGGAARTLADWTADGVPDLLELGMGSVRLLQGDGAGNFAPGPSTNVNFPTFPELPQEYLAIDLDDDGRNDLLAIHQDAFAPSTSMRWTRLIGNDDGSFVSDPGATDAVPLALQFATRAAQFVVLDADGDGVDDVIGAGLSQRASGATPAVSTLFLRRGTGAGTLAALETLDAALGAVRAVVAADLDGDGDADLVVLDGGTRTETTTPVAGAVHVYTGDGDGGFVRSQTVLAGTWPAAIAVGDVDADGAPDLVATVVDGSGNETLQAFVNSGSTFVPAAATTLRNGQPVALALSDFDGDRRVDALVGICCGTNAPSHLLAGQGDGTFAPPVYRPLLDSPQRFVVAAMNGDGAPDLVQFRNSRAAVFFGTLPVAIFDDGFE